jgi:hypothetical protein
VQEGWTPDPDFPCRARLVGLEETLAGKFLALVDRGAPGTCTTRWDSPRGAGRMTGRGCVDSSWY